MTQNPTKASFIVSPDHAQVTHYELGFFIDPALDPVQVSNIGTGVPDAAGVLELPLPNYPIGFIYVAKIRACVGTLVSPWSDASNPFGASPRSPRSLVIS